MHVIILAKLNRFIDIENYSEDILHKTNNKEKLWRIFPLIYFLFIQMRRYLFLQRNIWATRPAEYRVWSCWWCGWCKSKCQSPPRWTDSFWNKTIQSLFESALFVYLLWKMLLQTLTIQTCRWQWGIWAAAEPDVAVQVPAHQMLSGHTAAADGAKPAGCCLEGVTAQEGSPPAWRYKTEEERLLNICAYPNVMPSGSVLYYLLLSIYY